MLDTICAAINAKQFIKLRYHDKVRLLEPYLLGEYTEDADAALRSKRC
jgi:hypothetical protein